MATLACLECLPYIYALYLCLISMPYIYALDLCLIWQKMPTSKQNTPAITSKRDLLYQQKRPAIWQKRPTIEQKRPAIPAKETCYTSKRDLLLRAKTLATMASHTYRTCMPYIYTLCKCMPYIYTLCKWMPYIDTRWDTLNTYNHLTCKHMYLQSPHM